MKKISTASSKQKIGFKGMVYSVDESVLGMEYCPNSYNFTFRGGVLKSDLGVDSAMGHVTYDEAVRHRFKDIPDGQRIKDVFVYHRKNNGVYDDRLVVQTVEGNFYDAKIFEIGNWTKIDGIVTKQDVCAVSYNFNGNDILIISGEQIGLMIYNGSTVVKVEGAPAFSSIVIHYERVFGVVNGKENQVWFSSVLDPTNWTVSGEEAGFITFQDECGDVEEIVSFSGYIYIFREHGIFRLTAYGDQSEFSLKKVFTDTGRIYKSTIATAGNKILFYTDAGIFTFDGYNVSRLNVEIPTILLPQYICGAYLENKYYLGCRIDHEGLEDKVGTNSAILEYDLKESTLSILAPCDVKKLVPMKAHHATDMLVVFNGSNSKKLGMIVDRGVIFDEEISKFYRSPYNDFGTDKVKIVREMIVTTKHPLTVSVVYDGQERAFNFAGSSSPKKVFVDRCGVEIGFKISTTAQKAQVAPIVVKIDSM